MPKNESEGNKDLHFQYNVDLSNPTPSSLEAIKSDLIKKITSNVAKELKDLEGAHPEMMSSFDRHYSIHSKG